MQQKQREDTRSNTNLSASFNIFLACSESMMYGHTVVTTTFEPNSCSSWSKASIMPTTGKRSCFTFRAKRVPVYS